MDDGDLYGFSDHLRCDKEVSKNLKALEITTGVGRIAMAVLKVYFNRVDVLQVLENPFDKLFYKC